MTTTQTTIAASVVRSMSALATLNTLRQAAGKKPLKAWKESRAKLDEAIEKAHADAPITSKTPDVPAKAVIAKLDDSKKKMIIKVECKHSMPTFLCRKCTPERNDYGTTSRREAPRPAESIKSVAIKPTLSAEQQKIRDADRNQFRKKPKTGQRSRFDWDAAEVAAKAGKLPAIPDFSANTHKYYRAALAAVVELVKVGDVKKLQSHKVSDRDDGSPLIIKRYQKLAVVALKAKA